MKARDRELAAIRHKTADRIPTDVICIENGDQVAQMLQIDPAAVYDVLGIDGRILSAGYTGELPRLPDGTTLSEWHTPNTGDYGTGRAYPLAAAGISEVERFSWPDPDGYNFAAAAAAARDLGATYAVRGPYWKPLFCQVCDLVGMEEAMVKMLADPLLFEVLLDRVFEHTARFCEQLLDACGDSMPIFCLGDDFATQKGLMIDPGKWRQFLKPRYAKLFEMAKKREKFVWFHSCGDITAVLPDLIDIGMDVWETVQLHTLPMSPEQLKQEYGRHITFFGAVSTQRLPFATPDEVRDEVIRCIDALGKDGGYICGPDHHIKPDVSAENTVVLFSTARRYTQREEKRQPG